MGTTSIGKLRTTIASVERRLEELDRTKVSLFDELRKQVCADPDRAEIWNASKGPDAFDASMDLVSHDAELWAAWEACSRASDEFFAISLRLQSLRRLLERAEQVSHDTKTATEAAS